MIIHVTSQLKDLLVGPLQLSQAACPELPPYLIIIDALDEIVGGSAFLRDLLLAIDKYDLRGLKFLVTSRTDPKLNTLCESFTSKGVCRLQDVPIEVVSDIETHLKTELPELASSSKLVKLQRSGTRKFIDAAMAVKYLTSRDSIPVGKQTEMLDDFLPQYEPTSSSNATFSIDELYRQIMLDAFSNLNGEVLACRLRALYTFLCAAEHVSASTVAALVSDVDDGDARAILRDLRALLYIDDDRVFWYHNSFRDFIFTKARSNFSIGNKNFTFSCNEAAHHSLLCESCFSIMKSEKSSLRFNTGNRTSSFLSDHDNTVELSELVNQNIGAVLRYSSCYWTHHLPLPQLINTGNLCRCISEFIQNHVLFWIEVMALLGSHFQCTPMLQFAYQWVLKVWILRH